MNENARTRILWSLAIGFLALLLFYRLFISFSYKQELVNGESNNIWNALNVAHGKPMYSNPEDLPLEVFQYTPMSQLPIVFFASILDSDSSDYLYRNSVFGRLTVLLYNLLTGYIIYLILIRFYNTDKFTAGLGSLLFFSTLSHPAFAIRPDAFLLLANVCLAYGFVSALLEARTNRLYLMSFLVGMAMLIKQDAFFIMGPVGLFLLMYWRKKELFFSSLFFIAGVFFFFGLAHLLFGEYFFYSVTKGIQMKSSLSQAISVFDRAISLYGFQFAFSLIVACYFLVFKRDNQKVLLLSLFNLVYMFLGFAASFKPGSWVNYYTLFILFGSVSLIHFFHTNVKIPNSKQFLLVMVLLVGGIFWSRQVYFYTLPYLKYAESKAEYEAVYRTSVKIKKVLELNKDDRIIIAHPLLRNFLFNHSIMVNTEYYGISGFNYDKFRSDENKKINYIIALEKELDIIKMLGTTFHVDFDSFLPIQKIDNFIIYRKNAKLP